MKYSVIAKRMESVATYSEARNEYLKQLSTWIVPYMINYYRNLWTESNAIGGQRRGMIVFQEKCSEVPKWNHDMIEANVGKLLDSCRCDYLEELMSAVFIAHTKVLISVRISAKHKKLQITLPKLDHFIHRIFSECARSFWKVPYLFLDEHKPIEMQKNLLQAEALCAESISSAVRSLLPIKNILNEYLSEDLSENLNNEEKEEKEEKPDMKKEQQNKDDDLKLTQKKIITQEAIVSEAIVSEAIVNEDIVSEAVVKEDIAVADSNVIESIVREAVATGEPCVSDKNMKIVSDQLESIDSDTKPNISNELNMNSLSDNANLSSEEIVIDTEPSVHFCNYDNIFDENSEQIGTFSYVPKDDSTPILEIKEDNGVSLSDDLSISNLDTPGVINSDEFLD